MSRLGRPESRLRSDRSLSDDRGWDLGSSSGLPRASSSPVRSRDGGRRGDPPLLLCVHTLIHSFHLTSSPQLQSSQVENPSLIPAHIPLNSIIRLSLLLVNMQFKSFLVSLAVLGGCHDQNTTQNIAERETDLSCLHPSAAGLTSVVSAYQLGQGANMLQPRAIHFETADGQIFIPRSLVYDNGGDLRLERRQHWAGSWQPSQTGHWSGGWGSGGGGGGAR